jgi:hypothetical protein
LAGLPLRLLDEGWIRQLRSSCRRSQSFIEYSVRVRSPAALAAIAARHGCARGYPPLATP